MYEFNYHRPSSIDEAKKILGDNDEAKLLAGGMTLLPTMKMRLASPSDLIDLSNIPNPSGEAMMSLPRSAPAGETCVL